MFVIKSNTILPRHYISNFLQSRPVYSLRAVVRATTHEDFEKNLGKLRYSVVNYKRLVRATIPIPPIKGKNTFFLLMTLNIDSEPKTIIERKVLPIIEQKACCKEVLNQQDIQES